MTPKKIVSWTAALVGGGGALTLLFWGVPYYLQASVHDLFMDEVADAGPPSIPVAVTENTAAINAFSSQLNSMEMRMIERDRIQAERDAVIMQYFADKAAN